MNYYCFISGSKDLSFDSPKTTPPMKELLEEYQSILSKRDAQMLYLLRLAYDNDNLLELIDDKDVSVHELGNISLLTWMEAMPLMQDSTPKEIYKEFGIEEYFTTFYQAMMDENQRAKIIHPKNYLHSLYLDHARKKANSFLEKWFDYNINMNNVITAIICKKHSIDIAPNLIGKNEIVETIRNNFNSKDLGLNGIYDEVDTLNAIYENRYLIEQEKRYDAMKWSWLEENTFFEPFSINQLLAYWLKCQLIHRWDNLTIEEGTAVFKDILYDLKKDIKGTI